MSNENKMKTMLAGAFMITMVGILIYAYRLNKTNSRVSESEESTKNIIDTFSEKFLSKLSEAESKIKDTVSEKKFHLPPGEFGVFL
jgi:hypothetical protein